MRSRGRMVQTRWVWLLASLAACGNKQHASETKAQKLTSPEVTVGQRLGLLPSTATSFAALELIDAPASLPSTDPCISGGGINNKGIVVGWDCRVSENFAPTPQVAPALSSEPSGQVGLTTWSLNAVATTALSLPTGATSIFPTVINNSGDIAGTGYSASTGKWLPPTFWMHTDHSCGSPNNVLPAINTVPLPSGSGDTSIGGMTNDVCPVIAGATVQAGSSAYKWFRYDSNPTTGGITILEIPSGYVNSQADAINSSKEMSGTLWTSDGTWWAAAYRDNAWVYLTDGLQSGSGFTRLEEGRAINDNHQIVGSGIADSAGGCSGNCRRAFIADLNTFQSGSGPGATGRVLDLGTLPGAPTSAEYVAEAINSKGHVVGAIFSEGTAERPSSNPSRAFIWTREWGMRDLLGFLDPALGIDAADVSAMNATGINDNDEVVGWIKRPGYGFRLFRMKIDLGPEFIEPTNGQSATVAKGINNKGVVVGWSDAHAADFPGTSMAYPFVADATGPHPLTVPVSGATAFPWGINDAGYVVGGAYQASNGHASPALIYEPGSLTAVTPSFVGDAGITAVSSAPTPMFVGGAVDPTPGTEQWFWAGPDYEPHFLPALEFGSVGDAFAVNKAGDMAGFHIRPGGQWVAGVYTGGQMGNLNNLVSNLGSWNLTVAFGINDNKQVVGVGKPTGNGTDHAFMVDLTSDVVVVTDLGLLGGMATSARAINKSGYVVGVAGSAADSQGYRFVPQRAFVYSLESGMTDLNDLVPMPPGWTLKDAVAINDHNEVVGYAEDADGHRRAYKVRIPNLPAQAGLSNLQPISYSLDHPGRVSINIYDQEGHIVRELLHGAARPAGSNTEYWNGRDDSGAALPDNTTYSWKMLSTPGFSVEYLMSPGASFSFNPNGPFWALSPTSGEGPQALAVESDGLYVGAMPENNTAILKQTLDGNTRIWSAKSPGNFAGPIAFGLTDQFLWSYSMQTAELYRFVKSPATPRKHGELATAHIVPSYPGVDGPERLVTDMAVIDDAHFVFAYRGLGKVAWRELNTQTSEFPATLSREVSIPDVRSVDVALDGTTYVLAGDKLLKITPETTSLETAVELASGLREPRRAAVRPDPAHPDIYVLEGTPAVGTPGDHVKCFTSTGLSCGCYGGPRPDGIYQPAKLRDAQDIAVSANGDFWIAESIAAPKRVAHFEADPNSTCNAPTADNLVAEWYGGQFWGPAVTVEPDDPTYAWITSGEPRTCEGNPCPYFTELMRMKLDYANRTWSVDSVTKLDGKALGLSGGYGNLDWDARMRGNDLYLLPSGGASAFKYDRENHVLVPETILTIGLTGTQPYTAPYPPSTPTENWLCPTSETTPIRQTMLWTDANADGEPDCGTCSAPLGSECVYSATAALPWVTGFSGSLLEYLSVVPVGQGIYIRRLSPSTSGPLSYPAFPNGELFATAPDVTSANVYAYHLTSDAAGRVWGAFNSGWDATWTATDPFIVRYNSDNTLAWRAGRPGHSPGSIRSVRHVFGVVNNTLVFGPWADFWEGEGVTPVYAYNEDGLYAGQIFGRPVDPNVPTWRYALGAEGRGGKIFKTANGDVYLLSSWVNEARLFKITGWDNWETANGSVDVPDNYSAPPSVPEATGPIGRGRGLWGRYYATEDWSGPPAKERLDPVLDSDELEPVGLAQYSVLWTGTLTPRRTGWHMFTQREGHRAVDEASFNEYYVGGISVADPLTSERSIWLEAGRKYPVKIKITTDHPPPDPALGGNDVYRPFGVKWWWAEPEINAYIGFKCLTAGCRHDAFVGFEIVPTSQLDPPAVSTEWVWGEQ